MFSIEIFKKKEIPDAEGNDVLASIRDFKINAETVRVGQYYILEGSPTPVELERIARDILLDPVIEEFSIQSVSLPVQEKIDADAHGPWEVLKLFHFGVTDNVGETTLNAIKEAGITTVSHVMTGKKYRIGPDLALKHIKEISARILANAIIESCTFRKI
jgi:phosphoribosylformylglycinamidine (FGAM) synthase PurS component